MSASVTHDVLYIPPTCALCGGEIAEREDSMNVWLHGTHPGGVAEQGIAHVECVAPSPPKKQCAHADVLNLSHEPDYASIYWCMDCGAHSYDREHWEMPTMLGGE